MYKAGRAAAGVWRLNNLVSFGLLTHFCYGSLVRYSDCELMTKLIVHHVMTVPNDVHVTLLCLRLEQFYGKHKFLEPIFDTRRKLLIVNQPF
jgi:hypothetical protein